jgi:guanylate kinase
MASATSNARNCSKNSAAEESPPPPTVIVVIAGPGGVGKGTVVSRLLERHPNLWLSRSWTTRPRRPGEPDDAYAFVTRRAFEERIEDGGFVEWTEFPGTGHLYGTPSVDDLDGRDVILEIELDGYQQIKRLYPEALLILIVAPSPEVQAERLRRRGDDEASVQRRLAVGVEEEQLGRRIADYVVVNDDVDKAADQVAGILEKHHHGR